MNKLLFLYNELLNPEYQRKIKLPLNFIAYGYIEAKLYYYFNNQRHRSLIAYNNKSIIKRRNNNNVFGALFLFDKEFDYYIRTLDGLFQCSLSRIGYNHDLDMIHRLETMVTPIYFDNLEDFTYHRYREGESVPCLTYIGNIKHPDISKRIKPVHKNYQRVQDGIDYDNFLKLYKSNKERMI